MDSKSKLNKEKNNNNKDLRNQKSNEIKNNNKDNIDISKQIYNELSNKTFPNDNDFENGLIVTNNTINKAGQKLIYSEKKGEIQALRNPALDNDDFFNECNNDLFDYTKNDNNENDFSNTVSGIGKKKNMCNYMNNEIENNNLKYRGSNYNYGNNKNNFNYGYKNIKDMKSMPKKTLNKRIINENNSEKNTTIKDNKQTSYEDILKKDNEKMKIKTPNNLKNRERLNDKSHEFNKLEYSKKFNLIDNNEPNTEENNLMNNNFKNNYINKLGSKDNFVKDKNNMINKTNFINNNEGNNARIVNLQTKPRRSPGNQQKINKGNIQRIKQIQNNAYHLQMNSNSINDSTNLNQINNNINNNLNLNLINNNNISNRQQIYYQIPGYVNSNIINKQYNMQYINRGRNIQPQIVNVNPNMNQKKFILINPNNGQQGINAGVVGTIPQHTRILYNKVFPNNININPYGNIQYNMIGSSNIYPYQQNKNYQVSLIRK
jgi:hypothetical protein